MADHKPDPKRVKRLFARAWKCYLPILTKRLGAKTKDDLIFILLEEIYRLNPHFTLVLDENNLKNRSIFLHRRNQFAQTGRPSRVYPFGIRH